MVCVSMETIHLVGKAEWAMCIFIFCPNFLTSQLYTDDIVSKIYNKVNYI